MAVLEVDGSGTVNPADAADVSLFGISLRAVVAADSDYAQTTPIPVIVLNADTTFLADVGTGTLTTAMVGNKYDLKDSVSIDVTAQSHNVVTIVQFISTTKAVVRFNSSYQFRNAA